MPPRPTDVMAMVWVTLRAVATRVTISNAAAASPRAEDETLSSRGGMRTPLAAPSMLQTMNAGAARTRTTSNALTTIVATIVPARTHWASTASGSWMSLQRRSARKNRITNAATSAMVGTNPLSEMNATQSLLGHGFAVIPSSAMERSPGGAKRTY